MWINNKFFKYGTGILLVLLIIFMLGKIEYFLYPFNKLVAAVFTPLLISAILYYTLRPLVNFLQRFRIRRTLAIVASFFMVIVLFSILSMYTSSIIVDQFNQLRIDMANSINGIDWLKSSSFIKSEWLELIHLDDIQQNVLDSVNMATKNLGGFLIGFMATVTNVGTLALMIPFILFYFLKDDQNFSHKFLNMISKKYKADGEKILSDIDKTLASYIGGQMLVAFVLGILTFLGYLVIRIDYPVILAIFAMVCSLIPFFGAAIGVIPALFVAIAVDPFMIVKVLIVMVVVQQVGGNLISPQIMGQSLKLHPVTVLLLLLIGVSLYGFIGLLLVVPTYAAAKVTSKNLFAIYKRYKKQPPN